MKRFFVLVTLLVVLVISELPVRAYSSPGNPTGYVNDFAGILSTETKQTIENTLSSLDASTSTQVSVVTIKTLDNDTIENFAEKLFKEWGIGQKGKDNGVLLLVAVEDRKVRIEVGYGLEGALTDAESSWIIRNVITPAFKEGNYNQGISDGVTSILKAAAEDLVPSNRGETFSTDQSFETFMNVLIFGIPIFLWLVSVLSRSKSWWAGGVIGAIIGVIVYGIVGLLGLGLLGLLIDLLVSKQYKKSTQTNSYPWWIGGKSGFGSSSGSGHSSGGFGGFGGGRSGGGGSSGSW